MSNFKKDPRKEYMRKVRFYPYFLYNRLDRWLKSMSAEGWHIVYCGIFSFWFERGDPEIREYFTYGLSTHEGKYSISLRYPNLEKTYGLKNKKSAINSSRTKQYEIVEIDTRKIDIKNDVGYNELINDRDRLYRGYFIRNLCVFLSAIILLIIFYYVFRSKFVF